MRAENMDTNRKWEAEQLAREQRSLRYEKERDEKVKVQEEKDSKQEKDEGEGRFQYMVIMHDDSPEDTPSPNEAAVMAKQELMYLDDLELEKNASINDPNSTPTVEVVVNSWFSPTETRNSPPVTRSSTTLRRSPRIDNNNRRKQVHFKSPRPVMRSAHASRAPRPVSSSPPPPPGDTRPPIRGRTRVGGGIQLDREPVQMPRTFPIADIGVPTQGTTGLDEPLEDTLPPPPPLPTCSERPNEPNFTNPEVIAVPPHLSV